MTLVIGTSVVVFLTVFISYQLAFWMGMAVLLGLSGVHGSCRRIAELERIMAVEDDKPKEQKRNGSS